MSMTYHNGHRSTDTVPFGHFVSPMSYMGEAVYTAFAAVAELTGKAARSISVALRAKSSARVLSQLDDHALMDIGVQRSDIHMLARRIAEDPGLDHRSIA